MQRVDAIIEAEKKSNGRVFVGTMRRFAPAFLEALNEVGGMDKILYARVRAIIGPNSNFVAQSGTFPKQFSDYATADLEDRSRRKADIDQCALRDEFGVEVTDASARMLHILGR